MKKSLVLSLAITRRSHFLYFTKKFVKFPKKWLKFTMLPLSLFLLMMVQKIKP